MNLKIDLLKRYFTGSYSRKDYVQLKEMLSAQDTEFQETMQEHWDEFEKENLPAKKDLTRTIIQLNNQITGDKKVTVIGRITHILSRAAAVLFIPLLLSLGILYFQFDKYLWQKDVFVEVVSPAGSRTTLNLPDGSTVWLNGESSIRYPSVFNENRQVEVKGEVFFKVKSDEIHPFLVGADHLFVKATGTEFNVLSYDSEPEVKVILKEGKVAVLDSDNHRLQVMQSGHLLTYNKKTSAVNYASIDVNNYSDWIFGKLVFQNTPMAEVISRMEHWYGVDIEVVDKELYQLHFKATFIDENIEDAFKLLQMTATFDYRFEKRQQKKDGSFGETKILITKNKPM